MKKFFTLVAAVMASMSLMAETETHPSSATSSEAITGTSYSIAGDYIAGVGGTKAGEMQTKGIKFRLNKPVGDIANAVEFVVTDGYIIENIAFCGHVNDNSKTSTITQVLVDGVDIQATAVNLPSKSSSVSFDYNVNATSSIVFVFSGTGTQANLEYTITYSVGEPSTDPELKVNKESLTLAATAAKPSDETTVKFTGKNLTPGIYNLTVPTVAGLTVNPTSVTVGEDGKLNAEITVAYASAVDVEAASANISLTIGELSKTVAVNYSADMSKSYLTQSINIEQWVMDNGTNTNAFKAVLDAANVEYNNIDALDSLNDDYSKTNRNYAFLGLKLKKIDATMSCWIQTGTSIKVKFGNVGANFKVIANGVEQMLTAADYANTDVDGNKVLALTAPMDMYLQIVCNSTKTLVIKQVMINEDIQPIVLPTPSVFTVTCADAENGSVTLANGDKKGSFAPGETVTLALTPAEGYLTYSLTYNGFNLYDTPETNPVTFVMPAEPVSVVASFITEFPTDINNTNDELKAVKVVRNGQLFIEKNGVLYNAQGAVVK